MIRFYKRLKKKKKKKESGKQVDKNQSRCKVKCPYPGCRL